MDNPISTYYILPSVLAIIFLSEKASSSSLEQANIDAFILV